MKKSILYTYVCLFLLVSCSVDINQKITVRPSMTAPTLMNIITLVTPSTSVVPTFSSTFSKTNIPTFVPTPMPSFTPTYIRKTLSDLLPPGDYIFLNDGVLSLSSKTKIQLHDNVIPRGRLLLDRRRTIMINRGVKQPDDYYYQVTDIETGNQINIPLLDGCEAVYPDMSPDGTMLIAACEDASYMNNEIIVQSFPDGKEVSRVRLNNPDISDIYNIDLPKWSRSGKWIAYFEFNHGINPTSRDNAYIFSSECFKHPSSCQETKKVAAKIISSGWNQIEWASQDRLIILEQDKHRFIVYDANRDNVIRIVPLPSRFSVPSFVVSADGSQFYFGQLTQDEKGSAVYRVSLGNGKVEQIYYEVGTMEIEVYNFITR